MAKIDYGAMVQQLNLTPAHVIEAIDDLNAWVCLHTRFVLSQQIIMNAISGRSRDLLIVVIGPARVGKTTLFESIAGMTDALAQQAGKRRGCFRFSVPPPDARGRFNWTAAITEAYASSNEILPSKKIVYGDITEGAPRRVPANPSSAAAEEALWKSFIKNVQLEQLVTIVDEGNTIPVTLSQLQVDRAIHALKYIVAQTRQPLVIGGTSAIRHIVEHDTQLKVRTKVLMQDPYGDSQNDEASFKVFIEEMEKRLGPRYCKPRSLSAHSAEIRRGVDGRCGLAVRLTTDALSQHGGNGELDWPLYKQHLDSFSQAAEADLAAERHMTGRPIVAAAEAAITKKVPGSRKGKRDSRVGATKNTNAPNHPYE
ncbi:hypothetical protein B0G76_5031 [Paraburkholderia sp. BL23I1N1]|uniref:hypothetical protein n=1 Tax=Paraburkholderia sp. BL23I1N1 TaxID=1938802 RepID=UPI000E71200C|nr:hypothetical protein [Paraburkholderia sp. BL23I1N1]RKE38690.1 hypothetical protein B0G76_5031 [Paraburkholderia sp. BL23I1N1]